MRRREFITLLRNRPAEDGLLSASVRRLLDYRGPRRAFRNEVACDNASRRRAPVRDGVDITDTFGPALPRFHDLLPAGLHQGHFAGDHRYHDGAAMHVIWNAASGRQVENLIDQFVVASGDRNWERLQHDVDWRRGVGLRRSGGDHTRN